MGVPPLVTRVVSLEYPSNRIYDTAFTSLLCNRVNILKSVWQSSFGMERFISLELEPSYLAPPIERLIKGIPEDERNASFFRIADRLHSQKGLNWKYALVSFRQIFGICPFLQENPAEDDTNPINSFRWLYLIHALASRKLSDDTELEQGKIEFALTMYHRFIVRTDVNAPWAAALMTGVLCASARLVKVADLVPDFFVTEETFDVLLKLLQTENLPSTNVSVHEFEVPDLFMVGSPVAMEYLAPASLFGDMRTMIRSAVLRLLVVILGKRIPVNVDEFRMAVAPMCMKGIVMDVAQKVLILLFNNDDDNAYSFVDRMQYREASDVVAAQAEKTKGFNAPLSYQELITLSVNLTRIINVSRERQKHWVLFLAEGTFQKDLVDLLLSGYDSDFVVAAVTLLKSGEAKLDDPRKLLNLLVTARSQALRAGIADILLMQPETAVVGLETIFPLVCNCGSRSDVFFGFLASLLKKLNEGEHICDMLMKSLRHEYARIQQLPNSHIYTQLAHFIDVPASYLDPQPCTLCNNHERSPAVVKLNDICELSRYTHDSVFVKLKQPLIIQSFSLRTKGRRERGKSVRNVRVYTSSAEIGERNQLLTELPMWRHVGDVEFARGVSEASMVLPLRSFATCLRFQFVDTWEDAPGSVSLHCPSCSTKIDDARSGICGNCGDNCYQCRGCKNINHAHLDSLICAECGRSILGELQWEFTAVTSFSHTHIKSDDDCDMALEKCDELLGHAHKTYRLLTQLRNEINMILSPASTLSMSEKATQLNDLYNEKCRLQFQTLTTNVQHVCAIRTAVATFKGRIAKRMDEEEGDNTCYNCRSTYIRNCLKVFVPIVEHIGLPSVDIPSLLLDFVKDDTSFTSAAVDSLVAFCSLKSELVVRIMEIVTQALPDVSVHLVSLACELIKVDHGQRGDRLPVFVTAIEKATKYLSNGSSFTQSVLQPIVCTVCASPWLIRTESAFTMNKAITAWRGKSLCLRDAYEIIVGKEFAKTLLFECPSVIVRADIAKLYMAVAEYGYFNQVAELVTGYILACECFGRCDEQGYTVLRHLLDMDTSFLLQTMRNGFFEHIIKLFEIEVAGVMASEEDVVLNLSIGFECLQLMKVVKAYLIDVLRLRYVINSNEGLIRRVITTYFKIRSLLVQRNKYLDDTLSTLKEIIMVVMQKEFVLPEEEDNDAPEAAQAVSPAVLSLLARASAAVERIEWTSYGSEDEEDAVRDEVQLVQQGSVSPVRAAAAVVVAEERSMLVFANTKGPRVMLGAAVDAIQLCPDIVIKEILSIIFPAPVVMDVPIITSKAPTQEDFMPGLLAKAPVSSNKIGELFRHIKIKFCKDLGMAGLIEDDHGLELLVLGTIISLDLPIEQVYKRVWQPTEGDTPMRVVCRLQGLDGEATEPMLSQIPSDVTDDVPDEIKYEYTTVLCENGFKEMISIFDMTDISQKGFEGLIRLLDTFVLVKRNREALVELDTINKLFDVMKQIAATSAPDVFTRVVSITTRLVKENRELDNVLEKAEFLFETLGTPLVRANESTVLGPLLALIVSIALGKEEIMKVVVEFFIGELNAHGTAEGNMFENVTSFFMLNGFSELTLALPDGAEIRDLILNEQIVQDAIAFLKVKFLLDDGPKSPQWIDALNMMCLPLLLKILTGMVKCHPATQALFLADDALVIRILMELENVSSEASIGSYSSNVLSSAIQEPSICTQVIADSRQHQVDHDRSRAEAERERAVESMTGISAEYQAMLAELGDETWNCCVCKEGYEMLPDQTLGVYVFANVTNDFLSIATYFTCVHEACHQKDRRRGRNRRDAGSGEWEAAKVRNCEHACNAIFPLPSRSLQGDSYRAAVKDFFGRFRVDSHRHTHQFRLLLCDMMHHISVLSRGERISADVGGGSLASIAQLWPSCIFAGLLFLECESFIDSAVARLEKLLDNREEMEEAIVLSLYVITLEEWEAIDKLLLRALIRRACGDDGDSIEKSRPALLFFVMVDRLQRLVKCPTGHSPIMKENGSLKLSSKNNAEWVARFKEQVIEDGPRVAADFYDFGSELVDEILDCNDLASLAIRAGISSDLGEFVRSAIQ